MGLLAALSSWEGSGAGRWGASPLAVSIAFPLLYVNILVTPDFLQKVAWIFISHAFAHAALPLSAIQPPAHSYTFLFSTETLTLYMTGIWLDCQPLGQGPLS